MPYIGSMPQRPKKLTVMLSEQEQRKLERLAESQGLNVSDYVRQRIRENELVDV